MCQRLIHRRKAISHADDTFAVAKSLIESLPYCQRDIFDGVMNVDV